MLSMNEILVCELVLGAVLMGLIFTSFADTDLIADSSSKSKHATQPDGLKTKPGLAHIDFSPDVQERFSRGLLGKSDGGGSGSSGK
jgi:hypothetical protein